MGALDGNPDGLGVPARIRRRVAGDGGGTEHGPPAPVQWHGFGAVTVTGATCLAKGR